MGNFSIGDLSSLTKAGVGLFEFEPTETSFEPNCLFVSIPAVKAVEIYSGGSLIHVASDVLRLRAGRNIRLSYVEGDNKVIRIDAIEGENVLTTDECNNSIFEKAQCIKTINGIPPDENGDFKIYGSECISVQPGTNAVIIQDECSQSCCGCDEFNQLIAELESLKAQEILLREIISTVQTTQSDLISRMASQVV